MKKESFKEYEADMIKNEKIKLLPEYILGEPMPLHLPEKVLVMAHLPKSEGIYLTIQVRVVDQAFKVRTAIFEKYKNNYLKGGHYSSGDIGIDKDYILKVTGYQEYLYGENQLLAYDYVRKHLNLYPDSQIPLEFDLIPIDVLYQSLLSKNENESSIVDKLLVQHEESNINFVNDQIKILTYTEKFSILIQSTQRIPLNQEQIGNNFMLFYSVELFHAGHKLGSIFTKLTPSSINKTWNCKLEFENVKYSNLPLGSRIIFCLYLRKLSDSDDITLSGNNGSASSSSSSLSSSGGSGASVDNNKSNLNDNVIVNELLKTDELISWVACQVYDESYKLRDGNKKFRMWTDPDTYSPIGTCYQNLLQLNAPILFVSFHGKSKNGKILYYPIFNQNDQETIDELKRKQKQQTENMNTEEIQKINAILSADPLTPLSDHNKELLWNSRYYLSANGNALSKFLLCVRWEDPKKVKETHILLHIWNKPAALQALELLDAKYQDPIIRNFGINCMSYMPDAECFDYMLQFTQVLKHEPFHSSALALFLLKRAWKNPKIGNCFFWFLKAEMHLEEVGERYTLLLEAYLRGCGLQLNELKKQNEVNQKLVRVAEKIKLAPNNAQRKTQLRELLQELKLPSSFQLPLDERINVSNLIVEKCKFMDSKKLPLWLVWKNADPKCETPISVIFKVGDDLRQDALTLQLLRIFDKVLFCFFYVFCSFFLTFLVFYVLDLET